MFAAPPMPNAMKFDAGRTPRAGLSHGWRGSGLVDVLREMVRRSAKDSFLFLFYFACLPSRIWVLKCLITYFINTSRLRGGRA